jgi:hypothetical protein
MKIELNDDQMKQLVSEAIYLQLDEKKREEVMKAAIAHLLAPTKSSDRYGGTVPGPSPLEQAFNNAIGWVAGQIAREMLEKDEAIQAQIKQLIADAVNKMMTTDRQIYIDKISQNIAAAMTKDRY